MSRLLVVALLGLVFAGCSTAPVPAPASTPAPAPRQVMAGESLAASLQAAGLPVVNVMVHTAETDPNKLLGRPNQYVAKINWNDSRTVDPEAKLQPDGKWTKMIGNTEFPVVTPSATVEAFSIPADLQAWFTYTDTISKSGALFAQYIYRNDSKLLLLRLPHDLTPDQAAEYQRWLAAL